MDSGLALRAPGNDGVERGATNHPDEQKSRFVFDRTRTDRVARTQIHDSVAVQHIRCRPGESQDPLPRVRIVVRCRAAIPLMIKFSGYGSWLSPGRHCVLYHPSPPQRRAALQPCLLGKPNPVCHNRMKQQRCARGIVRKIAGSQRAGRMPWPISEFSPPIWNFPKVRS